MPSEWWKRYESVHFVFNDEAFQMGEANGDGCNCLIDTLRQSLGLMCNVTEIRRRLHRIHPDILVGEYLELERHWQSIVQLLLQSVGSAARWEHHRIICVDCICLGNGDVEGT